MPTKLSNVINKSMPSTITIKAYVIGDLKEWLKGLNIKKMVAGDSTRAMHTGQNWVFKWCEI